MAAKKKNNIEATAAAASFDRAQLEKSQAFKDVPQDVMRALLSEVKTYTIEEAQKIINEFMNRKV